MAETIRGTVMNPLTGAMIAPDADPVCLSNAAFEAHLVALEP